MKSEKGSWNLFGADFDGDGTVANGDLTYYLDNSGKVFTSLLILGDYDEDFDVDVDDEETFDDY